MHKVTIIILVVVLIHTRASDYPDYPEGYFPFEESPSRSPPKLRKPPYVTSDVDCPGTGNNVQEDGTSSSLDNLCGDLNKGYLPRNPLGQNVLHSVYPFELIKNKTLQFFSRILPILKEDKTLPKVAKYQESRDQQFYGPNRPNGLHRIRREATEAPFNNATVESVPFEFGNISHRQSKAMCDKSFGVLCMLYNAVRGRPLASGGVLNRQDDSRDEAKGKGRPYGLPPAPPPPPPPPRPHHGIHRGHPHPADHQNHNHVGQEGPPTPCPSAVEYVTPVFAKNYQGVWRYVVQIPYEGYFTQTVEVTKCLQRECHYLKGSCLASPRWNSLLVAEIYYPDNYFPTTPRRPGAPRPPVTASPQPPAPPPVYDFQRYQQYLINRAGPAAADQPQPPQPTTTAKPAYCDGFDDIGCFQVRLYYDWFLIPGSCKCWKQDLFAQYRKK